MEATEFLDLLRESQPMPRLIVLNSCSTAVTGSVNMFSSTAAVLVRGGVPAVAAMQFAISDAAAIAFTRGFYAAVAQGKRVDDAVTSAVGSPSELP
ncbi:CHAT domain-containing protein [Ornithinimicrobium cerasi]|uniref:CHAT domain-containing protein n=1 Tax=Ornithinimicrobium cerasi TaxID=2248773 RepID=A0A285VF91_9MICO|nr:CHAT domain-containing protein [Ornithinimicrobium cerasi]